MLQHQTKWLEINFRSSSDIHQSEGLFSLSAHLMALSLYTFQREEKFLVHPICWNSTNNQESKMGSLIATA